MPDIASPIKNLKPIICFQSVTYAMHNVMRPNKIVVQVKKMGGPTKRMAIVAGSLKTTCASVTIQIAVEYRSPTRPRSVGIEVAEAELMMPESMRSNAQSRPAMVHSRRSILRTMRPSNSTLGRLSMRSSLSVTTLARTGESGSESSPSSLPVAPAKTSWSSLMHMIEFGMALTSVVRSPFERVGVRKASREEKRARNGGVHYFDLINIVGK